jgi:DNA-binding response OmpR family regulator
MGTLTVLIIDADESREVVDLALEDAGFRVIRTSASGEGVQSTLDHSPSIIIVGEEMPPLNGLDLLPFLRRLTQSPIIVIGSGGETALVQALLQGADVYLTRPINVREFIARVHSLLRRHGHFRGGIGESLLPCSADD